MFMINLEFIVIHHSCALILNTNDNRRMCESSKKEKLSTYKIPNFFIKFYIGNELKTSKYSNKFIMHIIYQYINCANILQWKKVTFAQHYF